MNRKRHARPKPRRRLLWTAGIAAAAAVAAVAAAAPAALVALLFALFVAIVVAALLAWMHLEPDVAQMTAAGAALGLLSHANLAAASGSAAALGLLGGATAGALLGDALRDRRVWKLLPPRAAPPPWWARPRTESPWLCSHMLLIAASVVLTVPLVLALLLWATRPEQAAEFARAVGQGYGFRAAGRPWWIALAHHAAAQWPAYLMLGVALDALRRLYETAAGEFVRQRLLRRIALAQAMVLLWIAADHAPRMLGEPGGAAEILSRQRVSLLLGGELFAWQALLAGGVAATFLLGRHLPAYALRHAWLPATALVGWALIGLVYVQMLWLWALEAAG